MEDKVKTANNTADENREVALGICFGSGAGIILGAIFNNILLGLSAGGVVGVLIGTVVQAVNKHKRVI